MVVPQTTALTTWLRSPFISMSIALPEKNDQAFFARNLDNFFGSL